MRQHKQAKRQRVEIRMHSYGIRFYLCVGGILSSNVQIKSHLQRDTRGRGVKWTPLGSLLCCNIPKDFTFST